VIFQIKGNAVGKGEIHSAVVAGGIMEDEFRGATSVNEMFHKAACRQAQEELGLSLTSDNLRAPSFLRVENATGTVAVGYVLRELSGEEILRQYEASMQERLGKITSSDDTAAGVVIHYLDTAPQILLKDGRPALGARTEFRVTKNSGVLVPCEDPRFLRPAAQGFLAACAEKLFRSEVEKFAR
jgi:hypothetical protein